MSSGVNHIHSVCAIFYELFQHIALQSHKNLNIQEASEQWVKLFLISLMKIKLMVLICMYICIKWISSVF